MVTYNGLFDIQYKLVNDLPVIFLFVRNADKTKQIIQVKDFRPYFYIDMDEQKIGGNIEVGTKEYITIFGKKVKKVRYTNPLDTYVLRDKFTNTYEADILFPIRFSIDCIEKIVPTDYRIWYLDIETGMEGGFPDYQNPVQPILCLTIYDTYISKYLTLYWHPTIAEKEVQIENRIIRYFANEEEMLRAFVKLVITKDPDIIAAYNSFFDLSYLVKRMGTLNIDCNKLSPLHQVKIREHEKSNIKYRNRNKSISIKGRVVFDLLAAYQRANPGGLVSFSLAAVAEKEHLPGKKGTVLNTDKVWKENILEFLDYNYNDVKLCKELDDKLKLISFFDEIRCFSCLPNLDDAFIYSRVLDTFILRKYRGICVFPTKNKYEDKTEKNRIKGATVAGIEGKYQNVCIMDMKGLYPTLIQTFNLGHDTLRDEVTQNCVTIDVQFRDLSRKKLIYDSSKEGILSSLISELVQLRDMCGTEAKKYSKNSNEYSQWMNRRMARKFLVNSIYGINALPSFRLYNKEVAETITFLGRELVEWNIKQIEKLGHKVVGADTDSVFIQIIDKEPIEESKRIHKILNSALTNFCGRFGVTKHNLYLELDKIYKTMIITGKKRYAGKGIWKDGTLITFKEYVGIEIRRSDSTELARELQKEVVDMLLEEEEIGKILLHIKNKLINLKTYPLKKLALPTKIEKMSYVSNLPRLRAYKFSNRILNTNYSAGSKFFMIYVEHPQTDVLGFDDELQLQDKGIPIALNWKRTAELNIFMKLRKIFDVIGHREELDKLETEYDLQLQNQHTLIKYCETG